MLPYLLLLIALLAVPLGVLVLRADPRRWDNQVFAVTIFVDSLTALLRSVEVFCGYALTDTLVMRTSAIGSVVTAYGALEFAYSFPFNRRPPWALRGPALAGALATLVAMVHPAS